MMTHLESSKPDYVAMAAKLEQIAQELRVQSATRGDHRDLEQAKRLERIAAQIRSGVDT